MTHPLEQTSRLNDLWAALIVDTCLHRGTTQFFLAPGSRCTPLTLAIADRPETGTVQHFDERGLAFCCLGYGRATGHPAAFVSTSGTAVANAHPAVVEASLDHVPMLLLTADRPPELRDVGANQSIDQVGIFGKFVEWFCDLPCPTDDIDPRVVRSQLGYAIDRTAHGPVHVNCMFREPFAGSRAPVDVARYRRAESASRVSWNCRAEVPGGDTLVIVGACRRPEALAAAEMATRLGCPLLADVTSGVRALAYDHAVLVPNCPAAESVVHVGGRVTSKRLWQFLDDHPPRHYVHITPHVDRIDPIHRQTARLEGPIAAICDSVELARPSSSEFAAAWVRASDRCQARFQDQLDPRGAVTEPGIARAIARLLPDQHGLFLANSMPVRDMDMFGFWPVAREIHVGANRGASGIDGLVASAVGFAHGLQLPTSVLIGDLALLHDLNSLALVRQSRQPIVVVVVNNNGGGIFHFLPIAEQTDHFERYFATPHGLEFSRAADMFSIPNCRPKDFHEFEDAYRSALEQNRTTVIELRTDREENTRIHRQLQAAVQDA